MSMLYVAVQADSTTEQSGGANPAVANAVPPIAPRLRPLERRA